MRLPRLLGLLVLGLGLSGCFPEAETPVEEQKNPYFVTGKSRVTARDYKGAVEAFEKAVEVNPRSALAHFELGLLYEQHEADYAAAIFHFNQAIKLRSNGAYPAENARLRIPGCKQEMIKTDSLATVNPVALRDSERVREENQQLRKQIEALQESIKQLQAQLAARPPVPTPAPAPVAAPMPNPAPRPPADLARAGTPPPSRGAAPLPPRPVGAVAGAARAHTIQSGETCVSIARLYKVRLDALLAANPGLEPKRMKVGQTIRVPAA